MQKFLLLPLGLLSLAGLRCAHTGSGADHICGPADYLCGASPDGDLSDDDLRRSGCARDHNRDPVDRR